MLNATPHSVKLPIKSEMKSFAKGCLQTELHEEKPKERRIESKGKEGLKEILMQKSTEPTSDCS
jgi:hypothetical protein